ncbi:hypothetical protein [Roseateles chitinivorans]|uniref:hypothetical protein n=1 Tax=Roseateles chitinivorans TaxID=2917965 RepID=UPI003D664388
MDNSSDNTPQSSATPTPVKGSVVSQRRRRFIQAGVVPVGLTLASRPAMAWHCNSTSAWGSAILRNGGASVQARANAAVLKDTECWGVSNFVNNTGRSVVQGNTPPWNYIVKTWFKGKTVKFARENFTVGQLFGTLRNCPGVTTSSNFDNLIKTKPGALGTLMAMARLNTLFAGNGVAQCVISSTGQDMLVKMASDGPGMFKPPNSSGPAWNADDFTRYLRENWLVAD